MIDYRDDPRRMSTPSNKWRKVTKNDGADLPDGPCKYLNVGTAGAANLVDATGTDLVDFPLQAGINPISVRRVKTGGSADDIWAAYDAEPKEWA